MNLLFMSFQSVQVLCFVCAPHTRVKPYTFVLIIDVGVELQLIYTNITTVLTMASWNLEFSVQEAVHCTDMLSQISRILGAEFTQLTIVVICFLSMVVPLVGNLILALFIDGARKLLTSPVALRRTNVTAGILLIAVGLVIPFT